jgi:threonine synthase
MCSFAPPVTLSGLECGLCGKKHDATVLQTVCTDCRGSLLARYDLAAVKKAGRASFETGPSTMWRFAPLLPVIRAENRITLGEGMTPLLPVERLAKEHGLHHVWIKDDGLNPTGTFKARGLCMAVAKGVELGAKRFAAPTAGNAGVALAAYAARAGAQAKVFVPQDAPPRVIENMRLLGADVTTIQGLISDAGKACAQYVAENPGTLDVSTLKEPYRAEGKKTMGLELAMQFDGGAPDVVVYPTGGGTGLIGIHKAYEELRALGWATGAAPRLVVVQAEGCAPVVKALETGAETCEMWPSATTRAAGLRVPKPYADRLVLRAVRATKGMGVAVTELEIDRGVKSLAKSGILSSPEGGAAWAGLTKLVREGRIRPDEKVVVFNTGSSLAY